VNLGLVPARQQQRLSERQFRAVRKVEGDEQALEFNDAGRSVNPLGLIRMNHEYGARRVWQTCSVVEPRNAARSGRRLDDITMSSTSWSAASRAMASAG